MDIVKAFNENDLNININIQGSETEPLFRASDVGLVLGIKNIHQNIGDFDESQRSYVKHNTLGGSQEITFLTEFGLYEVLFRSRKPIAKTFKKWICDVIKEIRINGVYDLKNQLKIKDKEIENKDKETEFNILENSSNKQLVYLGLVEEGVIKFGFSKDLKSRVTAHRKSFDSFILKYTVETLHYIELEDKIKEECRNGLLKDRRISKTYNDKTQTELIRVDSEFTINSLYELILKLNKQIIENLKSKDGVILKLREEIEGFKSENKYLKKYITDNGHELPMFNDKYTIKTVDNNLEKYYLLFLEEFINDKSGTIEIKNTDLYEQYKEFINEKKDLGLYLYNYTPFYRELSKCKYIISIRIKVDGDKKDNRVGGKRIDIELTKIWLKEKRDIFSNTKTSKVKKKNRNKTNPKTDLENEKIKSVFIFLKHITNNSSDNFFRIPNTELYTSYKNFSKLNDFSNYKFGSLILTCPGVTNIKNKIHFKKFNKILCQEWLVNYDDN